MDTIFSEKKNTQEGIVCGFISMSRKNKSMVTEVRILITSRNGAH